MMELFSIAVRRGLLTGALALWAVGWLGCHTSEPQSRESEISASSHVKNESVQAPDAILGGTLVTPEGVTPKGWIVVRNGRIASISEKFPVVSGAPIIETGGIIFPGFIDLHNHPMYGVFGRWQTRTKFKNRYEWRELPQYKSLVGTPGSELQKKEDQTFCDLDEYAEIRALIGGTTSVTGISKRHGMSIPVPNCVGGLIRDLDWASGFYGSDVGHERIENSLGITPRDMSAKEAAELLDDLRNKRIDLLLVHVAEGSPDDKESRGEFLALEGKGMLTQHTAIIHGTALGSDDFRRMRLAGTALVWSPRSNMELYGVTTDVSAALRQGVSIALAPDWSPTGSVNMLAELKYANLYSRDHLFNLFSDRELFEMATAIPARIAGIDDKVGTLRQGLYADLFVLRGDSSQPFAALASAKPEDVELVLVGGFPLFGSQQLLGQFRVTSEAVDVCGTKMFLNSATLSRGRYADVQNRLKADLKVFGVGLAPLVECPR